MSISSEENVWHAQGPDMGKCLPGASWKVPPPHQKVPPTPKSDGNSCIIITGLFWTQRFIWS